MSSAVVTESLTWLCEKDVLTEHFAIVLPVIFRKSGLPPAVEVERRRVMSDANLSQLFFYFGLLLLYLPPYFGFTHQQQQSSCSQKPRREN